MKKLVEVKIDSLRVSLTNQQRIIVLKEVNRERYLPIWIGPYEAEAITVALQEIEVSRPQTHDLVKNILTNLDAKLTQVIINDLKDDIFFGTLIITTKDKEMKVDVRPSDAIALAVREHIPIMVSAAVMDVAGIVPEEMTSAVDEERQESPEGEESAASEDRLSIFEEYLKKKSGRDDKKHDRDDQESAGDLPAPEK